jgi:hypothetical protein
MGAHNRRGVVWDYIAIYPADAIWEQRPPDALYHGAPVIRAIDAAREAVTQALQRVPQLR